MQNNKTRQILNLVIKGGIVMCILLTTTFQQTNGQTYQQVTYKDNNPSIMVNGTLVTISHSLGAGNTNPGPMGPYSCVAELTFWTFTFCPAINSVQMLLQMASTITVSGGRQVANIFINGQAYNVTQSNIQSLLYPNAVVTDSAGVIINKTLGDPLSSGIVPSGIITITPGGPIGSITLTNTGSTLGAGSFWNFGMYVSAGIGSTTTPTITPGGPTTFCRGGAVILNATPVNDPTYQWQNNGINIAGATGNSYTAITSGNYTVIANGKCPSSPVAVTVNDISPTIRGNFCPPCTSTLSVMPGAYSSYKWSTGATTPTIVIRSEGTYSVTVTDNKGCTGNTSRYVKKITSGCCFKKSKP